MLFWIPQLTASDDVQVYEMVENMSKFRNHQMAEYATTCIARLISCLALLRIAAIDFYYSSSRLARHEMIRTLQAVQLRIPEPC